MRKSICSLFLLSILSVTACTKPAAENQEPAFKIPQGISPCTVEGSFIDLTDGGHPLVNFKSVTKDLSVRNSNKISYEIKATDDADGLGLLHELKIHFNPYFNAQNLPPDGVYTTATYYNYTGMQFNAKNFDSIYIDYKTSYPSFAKFYSAPKQKLYLKRVNDKISISVCAMTMNEMRNLVYYPASMILSLVVE